MYITYHHKHHSCRSVLGIKHCLYLLYVIHIHLMISEILVTQILNSKMHLQ